jgi:hypothetical protein
MRLVVVCEQPADESVLGFLSSLPAVRGIDIHVISGSDGSHPTVRVLRQIPTLDGGGSRLSVAESKSAQQRLAICGPGSTHELLARYCARIDANFVIVMMAPTDRFTYRWSASVAERLACHFPVLAIPAEGASNAFDLERRIRWLVPLDGSPSAEAVLDPLRSLTSWLPSDITLLQPLEYAYLWQSRVARSRLASMAKVGPSISDSCDYLARVADRGFAGSPTRVCCATDSDAVRSIVRLANSSAIDAVAIGLSNRWRITRLLAAELNELLLRRVRKPILLFGSTSR